MAFNVTANPTFTHPVEVFVPADGGHRKETFKATFRVLDTDELGSFNLDDPASARAFLVAVIQSLSDLVDDDNKPVPYSDALRDQMLRLSYVRLALARTYIEAVTKARAGN
ncbi:MAG: hypothetical protein GEU91_14190 [Rhizobiales bacterium]|nr:hypothetical protein [Hyphomicrobiales bacterium]